VDLVIIIMAYLLAFQGQAKAGVFSFGQGLLIDIFSAGLLGCFTFLYLIVFLGVKLGSRLLDLRSSKGLMIITFLSVLLKETVFVGLLDIFSLEVVVSPSILFSIALSALFSALVAPVVFYLLKQISILFVGDMEEAL